MEMFSSSDQIHQGFSAVRFLDSEHIIAGRNDQSINFHWNNLDYDGYISIFNLNEGEGSCEQKQIHHAALINIDMYVKFKPLKILTISKETLIVDIFTLLINLKFWWQI